MTSTFIQRYFFTALLIIGFGLTFIVFWPFLITIILGIVFSVLLHPLYRLIRKAVRFEGFAAFLTLLSFLIIICVPLFLVGLVVVNQSQSMLEWLNAHGSIDGAINSANAWLQGVFPTISFDIQSQVQGFVAGFLSRGATIFTATVSTIISFILLLLTMFYFLRDGDSWSKTAVNGSPLSERSNVKIITALKKAISGIMKGYLLIGLIQGITTGIGLYIFGVPHAVLWGLIAAVLSVVPTIGTGLVSIPAIIYLFLSNQIGPGIGMLLWSLLVTSTIDNILNPFIVGKQIAIHPLAVLFAVLGGIALLGPVGVIIGPLIISFTYALVSVYKTEMGMEVQEQS